MDLSRAGDGAGFIPSVLISKLYPLRYFSPRMFARKIRSPFYITPHLIDRTRFTQEMNECAARAQRSYPLCGSLDLFILLAFQKSDIEEFKKEVRENPREVLVAIPHQEGDFYPLLEEIQAMKGTSGSGIRKSLSNLNGKMRSYLNQENLSFYWKGAEIFPKGYQGKNLFYSIVLDQLYEKQFSFPLRISRNQAKKIVLEALPVILDDKKPLVFPTHGGTLAQRLLREFLEAAGESSINAGGYKEYVPGETVQSSSPLKEPWEYMKKNLLRANPDMAELIRTLNAPPFGLSFYTFSLLLGVFWRVYHSRLRLYQATGKDRKEIDVDASRIFALLKKPASTTIEYISPGEAGEEFLSEMGKLIDREQSAKTLTECYAVYRKWLEGLTPLERNIVGNHNKELGSVIELFRYEGNETYYKEVLLLKLPEALGIQQFNCGDQGQRKKFLAHLTETVTFINQSVTVRRETIIITLGNVFDVKTPARDTVQKAMKEWYSTKENELRRAELSESTRLLVEVLSHAKETDDILFTELPEKWKMNKADKWEKDNYSELLYRILGAKLEIDNQIFGDVYPGKEEVSPGDQARTLVLKYLDRIEPDAKEKSILLLDLIEQQYLGPRQR